jgi:hypothetical protein
VCGDELPTAWARWLGGPSFFSISSTQRGHRAPPMPPPKVDGALVLDSQSALVQLSLAASNVFGLTHIGDGTAERIGQLESPHLAHRALAFLP